MDVKIGVNMYVVAKFLFIIICVLKLLFKFVAKYMSVVSYKKLKDFHETSGREDFRVADE